MIVDLEIVNSGLPKISQVLVGSEVEKIPDCKLYEYARKVSSALTTHPHTMLQFSPDALLENMKKGQAIVRINTNMDLLAFGQLWHYGTNKWGKPIYEFGSWLSFAKGRFGTEVLLQAPTLSQSLEANSQLVAIVEKENRKALGIIEFLGGKNIGLKESTIIKDPLGNFASMKVFDITGLSNREAWVRGLACEKGIPLHMVPKFVGSMIASFSKDPDDPIQKTINFFLHKLEIKEREEYE